MNLRVRRMLLSVFLSGIIPLSSLVQGHYSGQNCHLQTVTLIIAWEERCACQLFTGRPLLPIADRTKLKPDPQVLPHRCERKKRYASLMTSIAMTYLHNYLLIWTVFFLFHILTLKHLELLSLNSERFLLILYIALILHKCLSSINRLERNTLNLCICMLGEGKILQDTCIFMDNT